MTCQQEDATIYRRALLRIGAPRSLLDRALQLLLVGLLVALGLIGLSAPFGWLSPPRLYLKDFIQEYVLARAVTEGINPYSAYAELASRYLGTDSAQIDPSSRAHPPTAGLVVVPFSLLGYRAAAITWFALEIAALAVALYLLARVYRRQPSILWCYVAFMAAIGWEPVILDLCLGQLTIFLLLLLVGMRSALLSSRPIVAGILLGLALLLKPTVWPVFLALVLYRIWRAAGWTVLTVLLGYVIATPLMGVGTIVTYFTEVLPQINEIHRSSVANISLWSLAWRIFTGTKGPFVPQVKTPALLDSETVATIVSMAIVAGIVLLSCVVARKMRDLDLSVGLMVIVSVMISPVAWPHYLILAILPFAQVIGRLTSRQLPARETTLALLIAALLWIPFNYWVYLALRVSGNDMTLGDEYVIPLLPSLLTMGSTWALAALGLLLTYLGGTARGTHVIGRDAT